MASGTAKLRHGGREWSKLGSLVFQRSQECGAVLQRFRIARAIGFNANIGRELQQQCIALADIVKTPAQAFTWAN